MEERPIEDYEFIDWAASFIEDTLDVLERGSQVWVKDVPGGFSLICVSPAFSIQTYISRQMVLWDIVYGMDISPYELKLIKAIVALDPGEVPT